MTIEQTTKFIRDIGILGTLLIFFSVSYVKLTSAIIPLLAKHNDELSELIALTRQILEILRAGRGG